MKHNLLFYIEWGLAFFLRDTVFKFEHFLYHKFRNKNIKRRIFLSSGNISLINVLTIIKQFPEDNTEDILVIDTPLGSETFLEINKKMAQYHNFKKILIANKQKALFFFLKHNLFDIDEIYAHTKMEYSRYIFPLFKGCKITIFDEGIGTLIEPYHPNNRFISELKTMKYCEKFDRLGFDNFPVINLDTEIFKEIAKKISKEYPFDIEISKNSKTIIFCGAYWQAFKMGKEEFYNYQNGIMQKLIDNGFDVIYKPHPRDEEDNKIPEGVKVTNCLLPLELYNLDVLANASVASTASLQPFHYWHTAGFVDINENTMYDKNNINFIDINRKMLNMYLPNISELLNINAKDFTKEELKNKIDKIFEDNLASQPVLSQNDTLREYYEQFRKQEETKFGK